MDFILEALANGKAKIKCNRKSEMFMNIPEKMVRKGSGLFDRFFRFLKIRKDSSIYR